MTMVKNGDPIVGIVMINYNTEWMLEHSLEELLKLDYPNKEIIFLDNDSTDESVKTVKEKFPEMLIHETGHNGGYSGGAEAAVKLAMDRNWDYLMLMNPDLIFEPDYLTKAIHKMEEDHRIGALIGKLKQYEFKERNKTDIIDSAGLKMYLDRRVVDRGQSQEDEGQFDKEEQVFGITGAAPLYRVEALDDIRVLNEVFDQDFFMYKEDVDISWRMNLMGWRCWYLPSAVGYHARGTGIYKRDSYKEVARERRNLSKFQKHHSFRNQHWMQMKNDLAANVLHDAPRIIWKEVLLTGYMFLREPFLIKSSWQTLKGTPRMLKKRRAIMRARRFDASQMREIIELG